MDLGLAGTVAIVGGSSSGMGRATARTLAGEGCRVVLFARRAELLNEVAAAITAETGTEALGVPTDATNPAALDAVVDLALEHFGRLDIVVNNAGGPPAGSYEQFGDDDFQRAYELTLLSALRLTRRALPALRASGRGRIVNLTSSAVKEPNDGLLLSNVFRPGVIGWAKTISREEARHGITVNSIAPGSIATDRLVQLYANEPDPATAQRRDEALIPAGRFGDPDEIAAAVAFLCSTGAAYITGTTLLVDGGLAQGLLS
jgi:3-oxoacyl-[acyl-carrier protein] reductase